VAACRAGESRTWLIGVELLDGMDGRSADFGAGLWADQHLLEEGLVHELLDVGGRVAVGAGAVFEEVEGSLEVCLGDGSVRRELLEFAADAGEAAGDAVLFASEQVERDGAGVVGLQKLVLFAAEVGFLGCDRFAVLDAVALGTADLVEHDGLDLVATSGYSRTVSACSTSARVVAPAAVSTYWSASAAVRVPPGVLSNRRRCSREKE
jgi:hypothetical protein